MELLSDYVIRRYPSKYSFWESQLIGRACATPNFTSDTKENYQTPGADWLQLTADLSLPVKPPIAALSSAPLQPHLPAPLPPNATRHHLFRHQKYLVSDA